MSASIGGIDLVVPAGREKFRDQLIPDALLDFWPEGVFQDAEEEELRPLRAVVDDPGLKSSEFFVYQDEASAQSWLRDGWTPEGANRMAHFLIQDDPAHSDALQITMVIDSITAETVELVGAVKAVLDQTRTPQNGQPSQHSSIDAELRAAGCQLQRCEFYDLVDSVRQALYPDWSADQLACHPHDALQFCEVVRGKVGSPLPDSLVMRAVLNSRKRPRR